MLSGLMGALIAVKKTVYGVGEFPTYIITAAQPDAEILWSTWINGKEYEYEMAYGDYVGYDGTAVFRWPDPFYTFQIGTWKREAIFLNPDGTKERAAVTFTVQQTPIGAPDTSSTPPVQTPGTVPAPVASPPPTPSPGTITAPPRGGTSYPLPPPQPLPPRGAVTPPPAPTTPPDILNPPTPSGGAVPPRSIYPAGQEPRPPIDRGGDIYGRPVVTAPPDILNPAPVPNLPSPLPAPIPGELPVYGPPPSQGPSGQYPTQPPAQAPSGSAIPSSINVFGYEVPTIVVGLLALFALKGR